MKILRKFVNLSVIYFTAFLLTACSTTLAPSYDHAIVDGLKSVNQDLMEHLASTAMGTEQDSFEERDERYIRLIGTLDALAIQSKARPIPSVDISNKIDGYLKARGITTQDKNDLPSTVALREISKAMVTMRKVDKEQGLTATEVQGFKGVVSIYLNQALTYENYLER